MPKKTAVATEALEQQKLYETSLQAGELQEYRLFGSPGTGKTTTMSRQIVNAVNKHGSDQVMIASFTRTAAAELAGRNLPIPKENIATLHAHAYRAMGRPSLIDASKWNQDVSKVKNDWQLSTAPRESMIDEPDMATTTGRTQGDILLSKYDLLRAKMLPIEAAYDEELRAFAERYEAFKKETATIDFTDMIALALENIDAVPSAPTVGFFDEVQDFTPLELALVRKWGKNMQYVVLAGDDDQTLFSFKGATPNAFLEPELADSFIRVLPQSYRVPRSVHTEAVRLVEQLSKRQYKEYMPRFEMTGYDEKTRRRTYDESRIAEGLVTRRRYNFADWSYCDAMVQEALENEKNGKTTMFLAACNYQTETLKNVLRRNGAMFHNPYRTTNGGWNPLGKDGTIKRILAFMSAYTHEQQTWQVGSFLAWAEIVKASNVFKRGILAQLKKQDENAEIPYNEMLALFNNNDNAMAAINADLRWLMTNAKTAYEKRIAYIIKVIDRYGMEHLRNERPKIVLGTIHSVKGGEADHVFLSPDLSPQGYEDYLINPDNAIRQYYVGMTRAFEQLHIVSPSGNQYVKL